MGTVIVTIQAGTESRDSTSTEVQEMFPGDVESLGCGCFDVEMKRSEYDILEDEGGISWEHELASGLWMTITAEMP